MREIGKKHISSSLFLKKKSAQLKRYESNAPRFSEQINFVLYKGDVWGKSETRDGGEGI